MAPSLSLAVPSRKGCSSWHIQIPFVQSSMEDECEPGEGPCPNRSTLVTMETLQLCCPHEWVFCWYQRDCIPSCSHKVQVHRKGSHNANWKLLIFYFQVNAFSPGTILCDLGALVSLLQWTICILTVIIHFLFRLYFKCPPLLLRSPGLGAWMVTNFYMGTKAH